MEATTLPVLLLLFALLLAGQRGCCAGGFSVEFIHRDSARSPFHDPALSRHERMLAAARRSIGGGAGEEAAPPPAAVDAGGAMSEIVTRSFEYLMSVRLGTPPRQVLAIADTGSDLVWVGCRNDSSSRGGVGESGDSSSSSSPTTMPRAVFDPSQSSSYGVVSCTSDACQALSEASCDAASNCQYQYGYGDGSHTVGVLSTETFSFGGNGDVPRRVDGVEFGCSTYSAGTFRADGLVGLGGGASSLITQLGAKTRLGRKFSYCLVPLGSPTNASSALNFGGSAVVSGPGAATTPLVDGDLPAYYTVEIESVAVGGATVTASNNNNLTTSSSSSSSRIIVDSGTTLTFLHPALLDPLVAELRRRIALPPARSPQQLLQVCYDVSGRQDDEDSWGVPDVTLRFGGGAEVTLRPENTFTLVQEGTLCLAIVPVSILGNVAQQNFHVGYDLDARTVTFAPADCARATASS